MADKASSAAHATPDLSDGGDARATQTRETWIRGATETLVAGGIDGVNVDALARRLGVTRGSFYWHFKDREELLQSVLRSWRDAATDQIIQRFEHKAVDPQELIQELLSLPFRGAAAARAAGIELAIRSWSRRDTMARNAVEEVDARRISYIAQCFSSLGYSVKEARERAFALYAYTVAESLLHGEGTAEQKRERSSLMRSLLLMPLLQATRSPSPIRG